MSHIYISYSRRDRAIAEQIAATLQDAQYQTWVDFRDIQSGELWRERIMEAIAAADAYLVLISPASTESQWLQNELTFALSRNKIIIPVMVERAPLPPELARFQYIDATENREAALQLIIQALEASVGLPALQRARQTGTFPQAAAPAPAMALPQRGGLPPRWLWIAVAGVGVLLVALFVVLALTAPNMGNVMSNITTQLVDGTQVAQNATRDANATAQSEAIRRTATAIVAGATLTAAAPTRTPTQTPQPSATPTPTAITPGPPTATPDPPQLTATALIARATQTAAASGPTLAANDAALTATALAALLSGPSATPLPGGSGGGNLIYLSVFYEQSTQVAQLEAEIARLVATDNASLSPQEAAIVLNSGRSDVLLVGMAAALAVGLAGAVLAITILGSSRLPRRPSAHGSTSPGKASPAAPAPEPLLQEYQVFISSSDKDRDWIKVFVDDLQALGYLVWWYAKDAPGLPFGAEIRSAIYHTKVFAIVVSPDSMKSKHVEEEVRWAEIYNRPIINVLYRETPVEEWLYGLAKGAAIDFSNEREYKGAMEQLTQAIDHHLQKRLQQLEAGPPPTAHP